MWHIHFRKGRNGRQKTDKWQLNVELIRLLKKFGMLFQNVLGTSIDRILITPMNSREIQNWEIYEIRRRFEYLNIQSHWWRFRGISSTNEYVSRFASVLVTEILRNSHKLTRINQWRFNIEVDGSNAFLLLVQHVRPISHEFTKLNKLFRVKVPHNFD